MPFCIAIIVFSLLASLPQDVSAADLSLQTEAGKPLKNLQVDAACGFAIQYDHSVALTPVTDYFQIRDSGIWLLRTEYSDFGAGLPHNPEHGQTMRSENGKLIIDNYNKKVSPFYVRVGRVAAHRLLLLGKNSDNQCVIKEKLPLATIAPPGKAIKFDVEINSRN